MRSVIINCDPGIDDSLAIMLAVLSKRLKVVGITTTFGNASVEHTTENALGIVEYLGADIPVAKGANGPIKGRRINANYVHGNNGLAGIRLPHRAKAVAESAEDFIIDRVKAGEVDTIISTAPLTNIAKAFMKDARAMRRLKKLVIMGGTVTEPGSVTRVAEFNFFGDPYAAEYVLHTGVYKLMIPRDITQRVIFKPSDFSKFAPGKRSELAAKLIRFYQRFYMNVLDLDGNPLPDVLTVGIVIKPGLIKTKRMQMDVETGGDYTRGMSVVERRSGEYQRKAVTNVDVAVSIKPDEFLDYFIRTISSRKTTYK